jgi:hypothetical protein
MRGYVVHTAQLPTGDSVIVPTWTTVIDATTLHVGWILHDAGQPCRVADELRARLEPDPASTKLRPGHRAAVKGPGPDHSAVSVRDLDAC